MGSKNYLIVPIEKLKPLEKVFPTHYRNLSAMIKQDGFIKKALIADKNTGIVLDGSHRYVYLLENGYQEAPVFWVDYMDENIRVGRMLSHRFLIENETGISKKECIERGLSGNLFPPRTTRHFFPFRKNDIFLPCNSLKQGKCVDISHLIADVSIADEIAHNKKYIKEIDEEISIIIQYLEEVSLTKKYLLKQIECMEGQQEIAFFPGKFHPPHLGHVKTILDIKKEYRQIIVGVTDDVPVDKQIMTPDEIYEVLKTVFENTPEIDVVKIAGVLCNKLDMDELPVFDILVSGNRRVLEWGKRMGLKTRYIPRSGSHNLSGTSIRSISG